LGRFQRGRVDGGAVVHAALVLHSGHLGGSEPRGDRTHDPRPKRPGRLVAWGGRDSQALATPRLTRDDDSMRHGLAGFPLSFAAPLLLTVREVAALLRVSTRTVYTLC